MTLTVWRIKGKKKQSDQATDNNSVPNEQASQEKPGFKELLAKLFG